VCVSVTACVLLVCCVCSWPSGIQITILSYCLQTIRLQQKEGEVASSVLLTRVARICVCTCVCVCVHVCVCVCVCVCECALVCTLTKTLSLRARDRATQTRLVSRMKAPEVFTSESTTASASLPCALSTVMTCACSGASCVSCVWDWCECVCAILPCYGL